MKYQVIARKFRPQVFSEVVGQKPIVQTLQTDTLEKFADVNHDSGLVAALSNPFAAVPSVHTCFSLIIGVSCFFLVRRRALRYTWLLYPILIVFSIGA